ncbi:MAG TPA: hypothetical protein VGH19_07795 [Verrucomicrobiae bacterium]
MSLPAIHFIKLTLILLLLSFTACDQTKQTIKETKQGYIELERIIGQLHTALSTTDWAQAKQAATQADDFLQTRALSWYVQILIAEEKDGIPAAQALLTDLRKTNPILPAELKTLDTMEKYFREKGSARSIDLLFLITAIAAENKLPHQGASFITNLQAKYHQSRNLPLPAATTNASTSEAPATINNSAR